MSIKIVPSMVQARIDGVDFHGNIVTVGRGGQTNYSSLAQAMNHSPSNTLILVYPGVYSPVACEASYNNKTLYIRGMGNSHSDVMIYVDGATKYGWFPYTMGNIILENLSIYNYNGNSYTMFWLGWDALQCPRTTLRVNKCVLSCNSNSLFYMGQQYSPYAGQYGDLVCTHTYLDAGGGYHFAMVRNTPGTNIYMHKTQLNTTLRTGNGAWSPVLLVNDTVTVATVGYGPNYANMSLIEILDQSLL